jgi:hypothetical protein
MELIQFEIELRLSREDRQTLSIIIIMRLFRHTYANQVNLIPKGVKHITQILPGIGLDEQIKSENGKIDGDAVVPIPKRLVERVTTDYQLHITEYCIKSNQFILPQVK